MSTVTYHLFARSEYADPLALVATFDCDHVPTLADLPERDASWLEVAVMAIGDVTWILRDGDLITAIDAPGAPSVRGASTEVEVSA